MRGVLGREEIAAGAYDRHLQAFPSLTIRPTVGSGKWAGKT